MWSPKTPCTCRDSSVRLTPSWYALVVATCRLDDRQPNRAIPHAASTTNANNAAATTVHGELVQCIGTAKAEAGKRYPQVGHAHVVVDEPQFGQTTMSRP